MLVEVATCDEAVAHCIHVARIHIARIHIARIHRVRWTVEDSNWSGEWRGGEASECRGPETPVTSRIPAALAVGAERPLLSARSAVPVRIN